MRGVFLFFLAASLSLAAELKLPPPATGNVDYVRDIKPLLNKNCYECHGNEKQQAGLRLDLRQNALRGGDYGPVIVPGKSAESKLIRKLVDGDGGDQMPPDGELSLEEIGTLRAWIDQGADFRNDVAVEAPPKPIDPKLAALIAAVRSAPLPTVKKLRTENSDLKAKDPANSTLLHHAAGFGTLETLKWLVESRAEVNATNRRGSTPLHWAIHDEAKARLLLAHGAGVNTKQAEGRTPLYLAALLGNGHAIIRLLLANGADPNLKTANGRTPLMAAAGRGDAEALRLLLEAKAAIDAKDSAGETALMVAASRGSAAAVKLLLDRGADARARTKRDETALGNAGTSGNETVVRLLLDHGAEVNVRNIRGYSPLMLAASSDTIPAGVVKLLLAQGADTSCKGDYDETAHDLAAKRGHTEVTRLLGGVPPEQPISGALPPARNERRNSIPDAVERALAMTEKQSYNFIRIGGCNSCHSQDLPSAAAAFARGRGLRAPREIPQLPASNMPSAERVMDLDFVNVASKAWELFDFGMNGAPKNAYTDAVVRLIKAMQTPEGYWSTSESRRPPVGVGDYQTAALAIYSIRHFAPVGDEAASERTVARAVEWLKRAKPRTTQDRAFHLLGLVWGGASPDTDAVRALGALQHADGGWSQMANNETDAYATGLVLYALNMSGRMSATDPVGRKGVDYLLRTQADDGTWRVKTRAIWLQPYFESGFPYGRDQFISTAGTAWAAMALAAAQPPPLAQR